MKMKKFILLAVILVIFLSGIAIACMPGPTAYFRLDVYDVKVDMQQLRSLCNTENCVVDDAKDLIIIRSMYDQEVGLEIGKDSVSLQLPFKKNSSGEVEADFSEDKNFSWEGCLRSDLESLKERGIIEISSDQIKEVSLLANPGAKIVFEEREWKAYGANAMRTPQQMFPMRSRMVIFRGGGGCGQTLEAMSLPNEVLLNP